MNIQTSPYAGQECFYLAWEMELVALLAYKQKGSQLYTSFKRWLFNLSRPNHLDILYREHVVKVARQNEEFLSSKLEDSRSLIIFIWLVFAHKLATSM